MERLGAGLLRPDADPAPARRGPLLPEAGPAAARPLREPAQLRPAGPGPAHLEPRLLRGRAGPRHGPLLHAGHARGHGGAHRRRLQPARSSCAQAKIAGQEVLDQFPYVLRRFDRGLLFYYWGNTDLDQPHDVAADGSRPSRLRPGEGPAVRRRRPLRLRAGRPSRDLRPRSHGRRTRCVIAMSDHGFTSWRRTFHLNAWLHQNGYLAVKDESLPAGRELLTNVDWTRTRAYGFGLNGLYVNLQGREKNGIVPSCRARSPARRAQAGARGDDRPLDRKARRRPRVPAGPDLQRRRPARDRPRRGGRLRQGHAGRGRLGARRGGARGPDRQRQALERGPRDGHARPSRASWPPAGRSSAPPATCASSTRRSWRSSAWRSRRCSTPSP